jgi:hypothetical protein
MSSDAVSDIQRAKLRNRAFNPHAARPLGALPSLARLRHSSILLGTMRRAPLEGARVSLALPWGELSGRSCRSSTSRREGQKSADRVGHQHEYADKGGVNRFNASCSARGAAISIIYRDRDVVSKGTSGYVYKGC